MMMAALLALVTEDQPATVVADDVFLAEQAAMQATRAMRCPGKHARLLDAARRLTVAEQRYRRLAPAAVFIVPPAIVPMPTAYDCAHADDDVAAFRISVSSLAADLDRMEQK